MLLSVPDAISSTNPRVIDDARARKLSSDLKRCTYYETCATYGLNVERVFQDGECSWRSRVPFPLRGVLSVGMWALVGIRGPLCTEVVLGGMQQSTGNPMWHACDGTSVHGVRHRPHLLLHVMGHMYAFAISYPP